MSDHLEVHQRPLLRVAPNFIENVYVVFWYAGITGSIDAMKVTGCEHGMLLFRPL
jgi:hypothetical protein